MNHTFNFKQIITFNITMFLETSEFTNHKTSNLLKSFSFSLIIDIDNFATYFENLQ